MTFTFFSFLVLLAAAAAMRIFPNGRERQWALAIFNLLMLGFVVRSFTYLPLINIAVVWLLLRRNKKLSFARLVLIIVLMVLFMLRPKVAALAPMVMRQWPSNLGASYLAFCLIGLAIDRYRGLVGPVRLRDFWNWALFFPSYTAGPIRRFSPLVQQFAAGGRENFWWSVVRVMVGIFKRVVLVNLTSPLAGFLTEPTRDWIQLLVGTYAYSLNIYLEFSAYTDIAVGAAGMLGFRIEENFRWPYLATNISAFWKRWHMSLTGWLRDYLFIPLGGSRGDAARTALNTTLVMVVIGLWHGLTANFLFWGLYHAAGLLIYRAYIRLFRGGDRSVRPGRWRRFGGWFLTFHFVTLGWIIFACSLPRAAQVIYILFTGGR